MSEVQPSDHPSNRRERLAAARREQILLAAAQLFASKGFHRATTKEIAEAADVAEGTLYNYFEDKNDMLLGILEQMDEVQKLDASPAEASTEEPRSFLLSMLQQRKSFLGENSLLLEAVLSEILADDELSRQYRQQVLEPSLARLEKYLQTRIDQGQIRPTNVRLLARVLSGMTFGLFLLQTLDDPVVQSEWDELSEITASMIFDGIMTPEHKRHSKGAAGAKPHASTAAQHA